MCGLERYANASVGSLSTEHKKRTTIGVELAAKVCPTFLKVKFLKAWEFFYSPSFCYSSTSQRLVLIHKVHGLSFYS